MPEENLKQAQKVYTTIMNMLDSRKCICEKEEENLIIKTLFCKRVDLTLTFIIKVDAERELVIVQSKLPFPMPENKRLDGAIAICVANINLYNGSFVYNINNGDIIFKNTTSFTSRSVLSEGLFEYMIVASATAIDRYYDQFFMLASGKLTIQQFIKQNN